MDLTNEKAKAVVTEEKAFARVIFVAYILLLFASAYVRDFFVVPYVAHHLSGFGAALVEPLYKLLFWITPTILYVMFVMRENPLVYLKLTTNIRRGLIWGAGIGFIVLLYFALLPALMKSRDLHLALSFDDWLNGVILVGILEEIPFRGLVFQQLQTWMGFWAAAVISSILFVAIHIPLWLSMGDTLFQTTTAERVGFLFVFGVAMCYLLKRSGSLWSCILVHSANDFSGLL